VLQSTCKTVQAELWAGRGRSTHCRRAALAQGSRDGPAAMGRARPPAAGSRCWLNLNGSRRCCCCVSCAPPHLAQRADVATAVGGHVLARLRDALAGSAKLLPPTEGGATRLRRVGQAGAARSYVRVQVQRFVAQQEGAGARAGQLVHQGASRVHATCICGAVSPPIQPRVAAQLAAGTTRGRQRRSHCRRAGMPPPRPSCQRTCPPCRSRPCWCSHCHRPRP